MLRLKSLMGKTESKTPEVNPEQVSHPNNKKNRKGRTALHYAVRGNENYARLLINDPMTMVTCADHNGDTPLHVAASALKAKVDIAAALIKRGALIDAPNEMGETPLHKAVAENNEALVTLLIKDHNADVNARIKLNASYIGYKLITGDTPLHIAFSKNTLNAEIISQLLSHVADVNLWNASKITPLQMAFSHHKISSLSDELIKTLTVLGALRIGDTVNHGGYATCLHLAANNPGMTPTIFNILLEEVAKGYPLATKLLEIANKDGRTPLVYAAANGNLPLIRFLKEKGAKFDGAAGELALSSALLNGQYEVALKLIENGANPDVHVYPSGDTSTSLLTMSDFSMKSGKQYEDGFVNQGDTALHVAIKLAKFEETHALGLALAKACLNAKPSMVNSVNSRSKSPAFFAVKTLSAEMAHLMWEAYPGKIQGEFPVKNNPGRFVTMEMEGARRGFGSKEELTNFFMDPNFKLSPEQEAIRANKANKYAHNAASMSLFGVVKAQPNKTVEAPKAVSIII